MPPDQPQSPAEQSSPTPPTNPVPQPPVTQAAEPPNSHHDRLPGAFSLFSPSWQAFRLNFWTFFLGAVVPFILIFIPAVLLSAGSAIRSRIDTYGTSMSSSTTALNITAVLFGILGVVLVFVIFLPFMYYLKLQSAKGIKIGFRATLKQSLHFFWRLVGLMILRGLIILLGTLLLIVPGLFMWKRYMLAPFYLVDQDIGVMEAMRKSAADSKPFSYALWGMIGVYILIALVGIVPLIGWLISIVLSVIYSCAQAVRYTQVKEAKV